MSASSVPPEGVSTGRPLPSRGSSGASSPHSSVPSADSDDSAAITPRFVAFAWRYLALALFAPVGRTAPTGLGGFFRGARTASPTRNDGALPGSRATLAYMPCSSTPAESLRQAITAQRLLPSAPLTTSAPHAVLSRLHHTACMPPVYASQAGSLPHHATLGSGGWPLLTGSGFAPGGSQ